MKKVTYSTAVESVTNSYDWFMSKFDDRFCVMCGEKLPMHKNRGTKTCSPRCRKRLSRFMATKCD